MARAASTPIDWARFKQVVIKHRVVALAADGLRRAGVNVPEVVQRSLSEGASAAARNALVMARETLRLQRQFDAAEVPAIFVKGSALAQLTYGELAMKQSWDIDLLTSPRAALAGRHLLERLGYVLVSPTFDDPQFVRFIDLGKECIFINAALDIAVELHWRLVDNKRLLAGVDVHSMVQHVGVGGGKLRTLADEPLFAYLCVHGTVHGWARLKWLADIAAFLRRRDDVEIERLYHAAIRLEVGRTPAVTLLLCNRLLGLPLNRARLRALGGDPVVERLVATALASLTHGAGTTDFGSYSLPGLRLTLSHFALVPGRRYFLSQLGRLWTSDMDRARIALPRSLDFLYHLLRLPLFMTRLGKRLLSKLGA